MTRLHAAGMEEERGGYGHKEGILYTEERDTSWGSEESYMTHGIEEKGGRANTGY